MQYCTKLKQHLPVVWIGFFLLLSISTLPPEAKAATLDALPATASPGSEVIIRGVGYPQTEPIELELVDVFGSVPIPLSTIDSDTNGRIVDRITVPDIEIGQYRLRAVTRNTVFGSTDFEVSTQPELILLPTIGFC